MVLGIVGALIFLTYIYFTLSVWFLITIFHRSDGNCWYGAVVDQIKLHNLPDLPHDHAGLRKLVVNEIPNLPQFEEWKSKLFPSKQSMLTFLRVHAKLGQWTDIQGIMCQATALVVGREIRLVGTANIGQLGPGYTVLESVPGADKKEALNVGYYQVWW